MNGPVRYLSFVEIADRLGVNRGTLTRYALPEPDAVIGATRGWSAERIDAWAARRPGRGPGRTPGLAADHRHAWETLRHGGYACECGATRLTKP